MQLIGIGKAKREKSGSYSGPSAEERKGRLLIAVTIARDVSAHADFGQPVWPRMFATPWSDIMDHYERGAPMAAGVLALFGAFRDDVTRCEFVAAGSVATLLRAWRDMVDLGETDEYDSMCRAIWHALRVSWRIKLEEPPTHQHIAAISTRLTRRYDLLPRHVREVMPS